MVELLIKSTVDGQMQLSLFHKAEGGNRPLLVGLHTWSYDRFNQQKNMLPVALEQDFNLLLPDFRGCNTEDNNNPQKACGSKQAKQDIIDAVNHVIESYDIDTSRIFLLGASGGGHMALLMAAYAPKLWRAVDAWVPISSLADWHTQSLDLNPKYSRHLEACCGGTPQDKPEEYEYRSPITYVKELAKANLRINHGRYDPIVPFTQSVKLYNAILEYNEKTKTYLNIFDGGHEMHIDEAIEWFDSQTKETKATYVTG